MYHNELKAEHDLLWKQVLFMLLENLNEVFGILAGEERHVDLMENLFVHVVKVVVAALVNTAGAD